MSKFYKNRAIGHFLQDIVVLNFGLVINKKLLRNVVVKFL